MIEQSELDVEFRAFWRQFADHKADLLAARHRNGPSQLGNTLLQSVRDSRRMAIAIYREKSQVWAEGESWTG